MIGVGISLTRGQPIGIELLLLARFDVDRPAPIGASLATEIGGPLTVTDTANVRSVSAGELALSGTPAISDQVVSPGFARLCGRAFRMQITDRTSGGAQSRFGWATSATGSVNPFVTMSLATAAPTFANLRNSIGTLIESLTIGSGTWDLLFVLRGNGSFTFAKLASESQWRLVWVDASDATATMYAKERVPAATASTYRSDNWKVLDLQRLDGRFASDEAFATARRATSSAGDTIAHTADAWIEHTLTAATGVDKDLSIRWTDDSNCWIVRQSLADGTVKLIERVAGVDTVRGSVATTWTNATSYRLIAVCEGATIKVYVDQVLKITYSSATFQQTATTAKAPAAGSELKSYPRMITLRSDL